MNDSIYCYKYNGDTIDLVGIVDDYTSYIFERSYSGVGEWSITINGYSRTVDTLKAANIIQSSESCTGIISKIEESKSENDFTITFSGVELKGLMQKRIIVPPSGKEYYECNKPAEEIIYNIIKDQLLNPKSDASGRRIIGEATIDDGNRTANVDFKVKYTNAAEEIQTLCETGDNNIGWTATLENKKIHFHIFHGLDRTIDQSANERLLVSYENDNIDDFTLELSKHPYNCAYVGGEGEGVNRKIYVEDGSKLIPWNRSEIFVDATDKKTNDELKEAAKEELAQYGSDTTFEINPSSSLRRFYKEKYDLGDTGTIVKDGELIDFKLTSITEIRENNQYKLSFTFGYDKNSLAAALSRLEGRTTTISTTGYTTHETYSETEVPIGTWYDGSTIYRNLFTIHGAGAKSIAIDVTGLDINHLVNLHGMVKGYATSYNQNRMWFLIPATDKNNDYAIYNEFVFSDKTVDGKTEEVLTLYIKSTNRQMGDGFVIIEYTKNSSSNNEEVT